VFGGNLYGFIWKYIGSMVCFGDILSEYEKYVDITYRYHFLWRIDGSDNVDGYTEWQCTLLL